MYIKQKYFYMKFLSQHFLHKNKVNYGKCTCSDKFTINKLISLSTDQSHGFVHDPEISERILQTLS